MVLHSYELIFFYFEFRSIHSNPPLLTVKVSGQLRIELVAPSNDPAEPGDAGALEVVQHLYQIFSMYSILNSFFSPVVRCL